MSAIDDSVSAFLEAACVPLDRGHASGTLGEAQAILTAHPEVAGSNWTSRRSPESVAALLDAGASVEGVSYPSGYPDVDTLLAAAGAHQS